MSFDFDDFQRRATANLLKQPPESWNRSDDDMNERARMIADDIKPKPAAVLVPIILRAEPMVLLTQRHADLAKHAGQIAFPGGRIDAGETVLQAALREAKEEVGLDSNLVQPIGYLDGFLTITHYMVSPVVALVNPACQFLAQPNEVDDIFEVPLEFLMNAKNRQIQSREFKGIARYFYVYPHGRRFIWGATAGMIKSLHDRLYDY
jgi:8-oxo-dGTP pyrophosphatase MutT (NUDIX family)